jgi:hypothetical protein
LHFIWELSSKDIHQLLPHNIVVSSFYVEENSSFILP